MKNKNKTKNVDQFLNGMFDKQVQLPPGKSIFGVEIQNPPS
jgi:hypothetical protein